MKQRILKSNTKFLVISLLSLLILTWLVLSVKEENRLTLVGEEVILLDKFDSYIEEGVTYQGKDVTDVVTIDSNINQEKSGTYEVLYTYKTERGKNFKVKRTVVVR